MNNTTTTTITLSPEPEVMWEAALWNLARTTAGSALVIPTLLIIWKGREEYFPDPIFDIWVVYLSDRALVLIVDFHYIGEFMPVWVRETFFCKQFLGYVSAAMGFYAAVLGFYICVYQAVVIFFPVKYFSWRKSKKFKRVVRIAIILGFIAAATSRLTIITNAFNTRCLVKYKFYYKTDPLLPAGLLPGYIFPTYYVFLFTTACLYIVFMCMSVFRRRDNAKFTKEQLLVLKAQDKITLIGLISFATTFVYQYIYEYHRYLYETEVGGFIRPIMMFIDRAGDPLFHYWRNSAFRRRVKQILGFGSDKTYVPSTLWKWTFGSAVSRVGVAPHH